MSDSIRAYCAARAALASDGPAVPESREPASVSGESSNWELELIVIAIQALRPHQPDATTHNLAAVDRGREILRNALARYGHQPTPPAEGEVAELVTLLAVGADCSGGAKLSPDQCHRAAELLQQQHPTPVPVSERLPGPEDCDAEGRCWLFSKVEKEWRLINAGNPGVPHLKYCFSHWLPATALPLPSGEVEA